MKKRKVQQAAVVSMRIEYFRDGVSQSALGKKYGIATLAAHNIVNWKSYKDDPFPPELVVAMDKWAEGDPERLANVERIKRVVIIAQNPPPKWSELEP